MIWLGRTHTTHLLSWVTWRNSILWVLAILHHRVHAKWKLRNYNYTFSSVLDLLSKGIAANVEPRFKHVIEAEVNLNS